MKKFDLLSAIVNGILSVCLGMAVAGCMATAFHLEYSALEVLLTCLFWAVITCVVLQLRHGWIAIPVGLALWWLLLWRAETSDQFGTLLRALFTIYSRAYGIQMPHALLQYSEPRLTLAMAVIGGIVTIIAGISLTRLRSGTLAVTAAALSVMPCFLVTDTVPHEFFLFLLLSGCGVTILTQSLRLRRPRQASRLTAMLLVPVMLSSILLFQLNPQQEYDNYPPNSPEELLQQLLEPLIKPFTPTLPSLPSLPSLPDLPVFTPDHVNLQNVGPHRNGNDLVMEVTTDLSGVLYLRGKSYSTYDGLSWDLSLRNDESLEVENRYQQFSVNGILPFLQVRTVAGHRFQYVTYYPARKVSLQDGAFPNPSIEKQYSIQINPLLDDWQALYLDEYFFMTLDELAWTGSSPEGFTDLPAHTQAQAEKILQEYGIRGSDHILSVVRTIEDRVRNSAAYSLDTPFMPTGEQDFAIWFLENSDTGYCIHFASAATVLLRAAGIPARYVEGFVTRVGSDGTAYVTEDQAHAWVEYWLPKIGWVTMEPTPPAGWEPPVETTTPTQPTTRPTAPTTQPTQPTTAPTVPTTRPTEPTTAPTAPTTRPTEPPTTVPPVSVPSSTEPTFTLLHPIATAPPSMPPIPSVKFPDTTDPEKDLSWLWTALQGLLVLMLMAAALIGQWLLRLWLRKKWLCGGTSNTQALRRWRYTKRLARLRRQDAPAALKELALKARFSQHTISHEELAAFDGYFDRSIAHLRKSPWFLRLMYRLIFAAY